MKKSKTNYSCPNCGTYCSDKTLIKESKTEFSYFPDPHYFWTETHKCPNCETIYTINNGT